MGWIAAPLGVYLLFVAFLFVMQRQLLYVPATERPAPSAYGADGFRTVTVTTRDGLDLIHWYKPPAASDAPVVAVLHGNAGHIGFRVGKFRPLLAAGFGLFLIEYRGYGGNPGSPSERGLTEDARAALDWLLGEGVAPGRIVLYGESLGTAPAVRMAAAQARGDLGSRVTAFAGVVLEAPFTAIADVAQHHYWYVPARWLLRDRWDVTGDIGAIAAPLLVVHGEQDRIVPFRFGKALFDLARDPKESLFLAQGDHNGLVENPAVMDRVIDFVGRVAEDFRPPASANPQE